MKNTISQRVADFLKNFPPFNGLKDDDLQHLSEQITIIYQEKDSIIFTEKELGHDHFYVVHKGAVSLSRKTNNTIVDMCDEGDIFGLRPLMANENYELEAKAHEESILYAIPIAIFKPLALHNTAVGNFLIESFASNTRNPYSKNHRGKLYSDSTESDKNTSELPLVDLQPVHYSKKIISCGPRTTVKKAAEIMTTKRVGAIVIVKDLLPIGIITDKDLRNKIVTGDYPITTAVSKIMTTPVITYPKNLTITQAQMAMMKSNISHLCLTKDGTVDTKLVGILSKHDIMVALGNNPAVLIKAIKRAKKVKHLKPVRKSIMGLLQGYLASNIPMTLITKIISELNDACLKQVIKISLEKMETKPPVKFAWLTLGSQGRSEQMLHTDQDNALIFEDVSEEMLPKTTTYFLAFSTLVTKGLNEIGYEYCPAEMMASNPQWCLSFSEWKKTTSHWIINPGVDEVLLSSIFFDYNLVYGDVSLVAGLSEHIFYTVKKYPIFFVHLAKGALQNPSPTGFFRKFLVEQDGAHKDTFDVKSRALRPLTDAARVLILSHAIKSINNTAERFEKLAELEPNNKEIYMACSYASKALLKFRTKQGLANNDSGRYIALNNLSKEEKIKLKRTFKTIKEIQELVTLRFQLKSM
jgi:CBS domain-containing protein